jgi:DNA helicase-2/ATP-dependent DNA helicase PcrA
LRPEIHTAAAVTAILQGGYPATLRGKYEHPELRLADLEQLVVLAAHYDSLERMIAELLLAGDVYSRDSTDGEDPVETLVLSSIHQAKGLEWSHVFIIRLIEESFPNYRALSEPGGDEEERRIFYVGITRSMNDLTLSYPLHVARGGYGPTTFSRPSRFLTELDEKLYDMVVPKTQCQSPWGGARTLREP